MTARKITFEYEDGGVLSLEGKDAQRWLDRHDKAMKLAFLAGMNPKVHQLISETGDLSPEDAEPMTPETSNFKIQLIGS